MLTPSSATPPPSAKKGSLSLTLPVPSVVSSSGFGLRNDAIFKIKANEAYIAPADLPHHLSFRKGQAFYALNHNNDTKCFFVSTEYATPFSRTAVNGIVPDKHFDIVELNTGKNKNKGKESNAFVTKSVPLLLLGIRPSKSSLNSMALLAALQKEQDLLLQQTGLISVSNAYMTTPSISNTSTPTTSLNNRTQQQQQLQQPLRSNAAAELEELERELRNAMIQRDSSKSMSMSPKSDTVNPPQAQPQPPVPDVKRAQSLSRKNSMLRSMSRSREMLSKFISGNTASSENSPIGVPPQPPTTIPPPPTEAPPMPNLTDSIYHQLHQNLKRGSPIPTSAAASEAPTVVSTASSGGVRGASFFRMLSNLIPSGIHSPIINTKQRKPVASVVAAASTSTPGPSGLTQRPRAHTTSSITKSPTASAAPKTPKTGTSGFFRFHSSARTPNAPTAQPSAVPYLSPSSSGGLSMPATPIVPGGNGIKRSVSNGALFMPSQADLAAYPGVLSSRQGSVAGGAAAAVVGVEGTVGGGGSVKLKSSLKKSSSAFWG
ncbi:hypothetical protein HDU98_005540 [Podochytrium sp. JEL0797]|nr:hypothetical protein HDU98_005540 [Podochytrium sp. JEL0797]